MAKNFKDAIRANQQAAEELDCALRDCLRMVRDRPETIVETRLRLVSGGRHDINIRRRVTPID